MDPCSELQEMGKAYLERRIDDSHNIKKVVCREESDSLLIVKTYEGWSKTNDASIVGLEWLRVVTASPFGEMDIEIEVEKAYIPETLSILEE